MAPTFRYRTQPVATTPGGMADGSDSVEFGRVPIGPKNNSEETEPLYTHQEYLGRTGESPAEKTLREGMNDHGRALEQFQKSQTPDVQHYPLDQDGDEDK